MAEYGLDERGSSLLMGQAMESEIANVVDPEFTVVAKMRKRYLGQPRRLLQPSGSGGRRTTQYQQRGHFSYAKPICPSTLMSSAISWATGTRREPGGWHCAGPAARWSPN